MTAAVTDRPSYAAAWQEQTGDNVFADLEYEPTCLPRYAAREDGVAEPDLPPPCGQCPQELFHAATEHDVLYGGAAGGGKTKALVMDDLRDAIRYPGLTIGAFRRSYPELEESLLAELRPLLPDLAELYGARYDETKHDLKFRNGSLIRFRHAANAKDATKRQGGQYQKLTFDERTLMPPAVIDFLYSRLRSGRADLPVIGIRSGTNPGGIGHGRVKQGYVTATAYGSRIVVDGRGRTVRFIQARVTDNPHLNSEYATDLDALPEAMRRAFRDGDWDSFTGQVFTEWNRDRHIIGRQVAADACDRAARAGLPRFSGLDWGWTAPWVVLTAQRDHDGRLWVFRELDGTRLTDEQQAALIAEAEGKTGRSTRYADPAMFTGVGAGPSSAETYGKAGVPLQRANNARLAGWQRVHHYLGEAPACPHHHALGWDTCPLLHVSDACDDLIRTLPDLPYDPVQVEDVDTHAEDHWADALRYLLMGAGGALTGEGRASSPAARQLPRVGGASAATGSHVRVR